MAALQSDPMLSGSSGGGGGYAVSKRPSVGSELGRSLPAVLVQGVPEGFSQLTLTFCASGWRPRTRTYTVEPAGKFVCAVEHDAVDQDPSAATVPQALRSAAVANAYSCATRNAWLELFVPVEQSVLERSSKMYVQPAVEVAPSSAFAGIA